MTIIIEYKQRGYYSTVCISTVIKNAFLFYCRERIEFYTLRNRKLRWLANIRLQRAVSNDQISNSNALAYFIAICNEDGNVISKEKLDLIVALYNS